MSQMIGLTVEFMVADMLLLKRYGNGIRRMLDLLLKELMYTQIKRVLYLCSVPLQQQLLLLAR